MKKFILAVTLLLFTATAANAEFLGGLFYNGMTTPGGGYTPAIASKQGIAKCKNIFFIASVGDCSVRAAMRNGGIKSLGGYDVQRQNIFFFQTITVKAWGN